MLNNFAAETGTTVLSFLFVHSAIFVIPIALSLFASFFAMEMGTIAFPLHCLVLSLGSLFPVSWCLFLRPEPAALTWARGVNSTVSGLLFAMSVSWLPRFTISCCLPSSARWFCSDRRSTAFASASFTTVGTRANWSLCGWASFI